MTVQITARHIEVPDSLKEFIESRVTKLEKFIDGITDVHVTLATEKYRQIAEINVHGRGSVYLSATESSEDLRASFTQAIEQIQGQAKKHREKKIGKKRRRAQHDISEATLNVLAAETAAAAESASGEQSRRIIESRRFVVKPLSVEEAVLTIDDSGEEFLVFRNSESERVNVIYRRADGNFGLIDPE